MVAEQKTLAIKRELRATLPSDGAERDFWVTMRQTLLMQLAAIEKKLAISRRCKHCGNAQS
jgi:hypothetical protein